MTERATAAGALARIEKHEEVCAERYERIDDKLGAMKEVQARAADSHSKDIQDLKEDHLKPMRDYMTRLNWMMITTLLAVVGSLVLHLMKK